MNSSLKVEISGNEYLQRPFIIITSSGEQGVIPSDDIEMLIKIASIHHLWFHVEGEGSLHLTASDELKPTILSTVDSLLINAYTIFGYNRVNKNLPLVYYKPDKLPVPQVNYTSVSQEKVSKLPPAPYDHGSLSLNVWINMCSITRSQVRQKMDLAINLSNNLYLNLQLIENVNTLRRTRNSFYVTFRYEIDKFHESVKDPLYYLNAINQQIISNSNKINESDIDMEIININSKLFYRFQPFFSQNSKYN